MPIIFPIRVERFAVAGQRGAGAFLDELGMLEAPGFVVGQPGGLMEAEDLAGGGSFCLLGEPGSGKTTVLEAIAGQGSVVFVPMAEIIDAEVFRDRVIAPAVAGISAVGRVTLVLDGLEECPVPGAGKAQTALLRQLLKQADTSAVRLLVGCRSAEYPSGVHDVLTAAFPGFARYELAPLRRRDVEELAASRAVPAEDFLNEVIRTGAGPLASFPLTLDLLLRQYEVDGGLHGTAAELYGSALLALADEHDPDRDPALAPVPADQVLAVAARLCCYLLVCGRAGFWTGPAGQMPAGDLYSGSLVGGQERVPGGDFAVSGQLVAAALRSALFTSGGPHRRVPAHARFAAYLAGRHLALRHLPAAQLRSLLAAPMESGVGIVPALRETAAWLLALQPAETAWAEEIDLSVLTVHGTLIDAPELRASLVEGILASPRAFTGLGWRRGWNLAHPGLGGQLAPVLTALADPDAPQPAPEQAYIALMLARQADPVGVITPILDAAAQPSLDYGLRAVVARTAAVLDEAAAVPVLAGVLAEIGEHPGHDPDDELRGIALSVLWPEHLTADALAASLTTPRRDNLVGAYYVFRRRLPGLLSDDDVPHLLSMALAAPSGQPGGPGGWLTRDDGDLVEGLLDRAFACQDVDAIIGPAAILAARCLKDGPDMPIPTTLDDRDAAGALVSESRRLRRLLAVRMLSGEDEGLAVHRLIWGWQPSRSAQERDAEAVRRGERPSLPSQLGLLGPADLRWALQMAAAAGPENTAPWTAVLRRIWDPQDRDAQDAAWQVRETPLWAAFAASFDPVVLGTEAERVQRSIFNSTRPRSSGWAEAAAHATEVLDLYQRAESDAAAFPGLVYKLHVDPGTGRFGPLIDDDLTRTPGTTLLPQGWEQHIRQAAWHYLNQGTPPGPEILDTPGQLPLTAQAGYLALATLVLRQAPGGAAQLPSDPVLVRWAPSVLLTGTNTESVQGPDPKQVLLVRLAGSTPANLPDLAERLIKGYLATRTWPFRLESLETAYTDELAATLARCLDGATTALAGPLADSRLPGQHGQERRDQQLSSLRRTLTVLTQILARHGHGPGITAAEALISAARAPGASEVALQAGRAAALGLSTGDPRRWTRLADQLSAAPGLLCEILCDLARDPSPLTDHLTEDELGELWELLTRHWPHQAGGPSLVSGYVGPDEQARHWRDGVASLLAQRGTADGTRVLRQLAASHPDILPLQDLTREGEEMRLGRDWSPVLAEDLTRLLEDSTKRLVRSSSDLADLIHQAILEAADSLVRTGQLLWDSHSKNRQAMWRPKSEVSFGAWLADQLSVRLERVGVVINREVRVRETTTQHGQAVDIQADAPVIGGRQDESARCRIELKGNWHADLMTAMRTQLADDYLIPENLRNGIYVTAWFDTKFWNDPDDRRRGQARSREFDPTAAELASQAETLRDLGLDVRSVVVYVPRPVKSARTERPTTNAARGRARAKPPPPSASD